MKDFKEKTVLIVGGSEGIGQAFANKIGELGAKVIIASRSLEKLEKAKEILSSSFKEKDKLITQSLDVTKLENISSNVQEVVRLHGVPDLVINSAGVAHPGYIENLSENEINQMIDINLKGTIFLTKILAPLMVKEKKGYILNTSSVAGYVGLFGYTAYCASKAGVIAFSEALREELIHSSVKVSVLCPPNTKTPGLERENTKKPPEVLKTEEKATVLEPEEVVDYALKKMAKEQFMIIPTRESRLAYALKRLFPSLLRQFVKRPETNL